MSDTLKIDALKYHAEPKPGKLSVELTTPAETSRHLSLAYSPGVAEPVRAIAENPENAYKYTIKGNLVGVISNGSAILGLGNLGSLASKPVMEGKALLFKRFANIDAIDIEVNSSDVQEIVRTVELIADTFGGINLEDIKAPECFEIEKRLIEKCSIPIFHDDQHGTAIVTVAGMLNALEIQGKKIEEAKLVCLGAGAAAISCARLLIAAGMKKENLVMIDRTGVIFNGRENVNQYKAEFANDVTTARTLEDAIVGADAFLGLSGPNQLSAEMLKKMADKPVVFACSNPDPEISPELAAATRDDVIMATGRSDYPNQVNNVLGFPFIFRGALDVRATAINEEMKLAAAYAIRDLAKEEILPEVIEAYGGNAFEYGKEYIIPKPLDPRLLNRVGGAVARAAVKTGVAKVALPECYKI
ncbi:malic enzyme-like NAD(P)-binding protein [Reinekea marinisedimentorum]|uniref:NADP-dependent malic enzyme n=1 Tax=Reinekea marinisedimentorum TaxID=230495 RepID=A0A4R3IC48_9GAMM|nr:malic enzyme-like NAD(P)-binding protein [Reinekea marinisedimentorum]TCS43195.1 malate dehydrogenase (oxaloacetate-decarboxylating)(NADP+) [Reinekea marinisedimentorum]